MCPHQEAQTSPKPVRSSFLSRPRDHLGRFASEWPPPPKPQPRYRIIVTVGGRVTRSTSWRETEDQAMADAKNLRLASYDEERREWYLAVPVSMEIAKI